MPKRQNSVEFVHKEGSPEHLGVHLFSNKPMDIKMKLPDGLETLDYAQILFRVLFSGVDYLAKGIKTADLSNFKTDTLIDLNPWFEKLGFQLNCLEIEQNEINNIPIYCEIFLNQGTQANFFTLNKTPNKSYHFIYKDLKETEGEIIESYICIMKLHEKIYAINFSKL